MGKGYIDKATKCNEKTIRKEMMTMPVQKVKGGYRYGKTGKVYKSRQKAEKQGRAIKANQNKRKDR